MSKVTTLIDYSIFPLCVVSSMFATWYLLTLGIHNLLVTPIVAAPFILLVFTLEHIRPERAPLPRDISLVMEGLHFIFNFEFGYGLALLASMALEHYTKAILPVIWPVHWPIVSQFLFAVFLYEAASYWQHRYFHTNARLWPFHLLHHSGARLDMLRAGRFHFVDFATVAFLAYLPLVLTGTPENIITMLAVLVTVLGILHHGNVRQRTPVWLDYLICTPAVHRRHHSKLRHESDSNYGNTIMLIDMLFGTYAPAHPIGPHAMGTDQDPLPKTFWAQIFSPFVFAASRGRQSSLVRKVASDE